MTTSPTALRIACLQTNTGNDYDANLATLAGMMREAAAGGARFVLAHEYALMMDGSGRVMRERAFAEDGAPALPVLSALARELGVWFLAGTLTVKGGDGRLCNRSLLISAAGDVVAAYDKIHMFDVTLPSGKVIRESGAYHPGERAVVAETPWGRVGMTVCYDLRFPHLYRALAQRGAAMFTIPSSFQRETGRAHWHTLVRARAIVNQCYVIAPDQFGASSMGFENYGHSLIVDPWGEVMADAGPGGPCVVTADLSAPLLARVRSELPALGHRRLGA